ncbi:MAG: hypothetical protein JST83_16490 [Bacteroidetes bacterium]|nr:hypothetical protein [Bacteroidota bacterium]
MIQTGTYTRQRLLTPSVGRITEVCLIAADGTSDLPTYLEWLRAMDVRRGLLLLVNVPQYDAAALEVIHEIKTRGLEVLPVAFAQCINTKPGTPHSYPIPAADLLLGTQSDDGCRTLYLTDYGRHTYTSLRYDHRFRSALRRLGYQTIACRDAGLPSLEGGDCLQVEGHLFIGSGTQERFGAHASCTIRDFYHLAEDVQVHYIGVEDPSPAGGLYHLDLYFAYAGRDAAGRHRFMVGYIDEDSIGDAVIDSMREQLAAFRTAVAETLEACYGSLYTLIPVPIIVCDIYRVSPLNGITECVNGKTRYYFPWPKFINAKEHPDIDIRGRVTAATQRAWNILSEALGPETLVRCQVPISYTTGSGQSLHCTVGIIGRMA